MKRILEILTYINSGGAEMVVYNYLSHMNREGLKFDILALKQHFNPFLENKVKALGIGIYYLPTNISKRLGVVDKLIRNNHYDVIHAHCEFLGEIYMAIAAYHGVKVRIMHSHMAGGHYSIAKNMYSNFGKWIAKRTATHFFGCGIDACKSQWGEKAYNKGNCYVINNAVEIDKFRFNEQERIAVRKEMGWNDKHVIINVGRFMKQKNHVFLIDVFASVAKQSEGSLLVLVGEGPLIGEIKAKVDNLKLADKVVFLGRRNDVCRLLNGADVFFLPSLFEGLPVVSIETQANGLPIVMSEGVTRESGITDIASFIPFDAPIETWVKALLHKYNNKRSLYADIVKEKKFDLNIEAQKLRDFYLSC